MADQDLGSAVLYLKADNSQYDSNLDSAKGKAQDFEATSAQTSESVQADWSAMAAGIGEAVAAASVFIGKMLDVYGGFQDATVKLTNAFGAQGWEASTASQQIEQLAESLQGTTRFSKEATDSAAAMLEQLTGMSEAMVAKAIPAIQDMSAAMGTDLNTSAEAVARAMETGALRIGRMTISFKDIQDPAERFAAIMETLNQKFGGMAQALGDTTLGSLTRLKSAFNDLAEAGGHALSVFIVPMANALTPLIKSLADWADSGLKFAEAQKAVNAGTATAAQQLLYWNQILDNSKDRLADLQPELREAKNWLDQAWTADRAAKVAELTREIQVQTDQMKFAAVTIKDINQLTDEKQQKAAAAQAAATKAAAQEKTQAAQEKADNAAYIKAIDDREKKYEEYYAKVYVEDAKKQEQSEKEALALKLKSLNEESGAEATTQKEEDAADQKAAAEHTALYDKKAKEIQQYVDIATSSFGTLFDAVGQDIATQTLTWKTFAQAALQAFGQIIEGLGKKLLADAAAELATAIASSLDPLMWAAAPGQYAAAAELGLGGAAAITAGAALSAITLAEGGSFTVPPGYPNDSFPVRVQSGEQVNVTPAGQGSNNEVPLEVVVMFDSSVLAKWIGRATKNQQVVIHAGAIHNP